MIPIPLPKLPVQVNTGKKIKGATQIKYTVTRKNKHG